MSDLSVATARVAQLSFRRMLSTWLTVGMAGRATRASVKQQEIEQQLRAAIVTLPGMRTHVGAEGGAYELVLAGEDSRVLGMDRADAILDACKKRVGPIVMTTRSPWGQA